MIPCQKAKKDTKTSSQQLYNYVTLSTVKIGKAQGDLIKIPDHAG